MIADINYALDTHDDDCLFLHVEGPLTNESLNVAAKQFLTHEESLRLEQPLARGCHLVGWYRWEVRLRYTVLVPSGTEDEVMDAYDETERIIREAYEKYA